jgi:hypothetical protein
MPLFLFGDASCMPLHFRRKKPPRDPEQIDG